ncbi:MAG: tetratricopeptide repeat protein [Acidobacteria bacterium]|nr:tetratricopeptide repeat protein [Acidobacteriota bacterium]
MAVVSTVGQVILLTLSLAGTAVAGPSTDAGRIAQTAHSDQAKLRTMIDNLFDSYRKEDLSAHTRLWASDSHVLADQNSSLKQFFETYDQIGILDEKILRLSILGNRAGARVSYRVRAIDGRTGRPLSGDAVRYETIIFRQEGSDWKIVNIRSTASMVLEQVLKLDNDAERHRLLDAEREWLTSSSIIEEGRNLLAGSRSGEAFEIATLATNRSAKDGDIAGQIGALELLSAVNAEKGDYRATVDDLKRILMIETVKGSNAEVGRIWNEIGKVHNRFGDYRAAAEAFELALGLREKTGDQIQIAILQNNLGSMYRMLGDYRRAMELLNRCLINSKASARALYFRALINLGNVYGAQGSHSLALKSYLRKQTDQRGDGSLNDVATTWNNIRTAYSAQHRYPSSGRLSAKPAGSRVVTK